jgi:hypothetical protein
MMSMPPQRLRALARRLASELGFQPSEIDAMTLSDMQWWLEEV